MRDIDVFLDPACPWCWLTARWIRTVRDHAGLVVRWRFLSLRLLDERSGSPPPAHIGEIHARGREHLEVLAAVRRLAGEEAVGRALAAFGAAIWEQVPDAEPARLRDQPTKRLDRAVLLASVGIDPTIVDQVSDEDRATVVRETDLAVARVGPGLGTPVITFGPPDGPTFFGPVVARIPTDPDEAVALWEALERLATHDGFAELRTGNRPRPDIPLFRALTEPAVAGQAASDDPPAAASARPSSSGNSRIRGVLAAEPAGEVCGLE